MACLYIVHLHSLGDGTEWEKDGGNQVARESPPRDRLHLFRIFYPVQQNRFCTTILWGSGILERASKKAF
jgi:hypothetical protein